MRLLIVDDDPSLRTALRLVFEDAGHEVFAVADLDEARAQLARVDIDGVLIDAGIAEGGVAFWRELEADSSSQGKGVLLTGNIAAVGSLREHPRVFAKPFDYSEVLGLLAQMAPARAHDHGRSPAGSLASTPST